MVKYSNPALDATFAALADPTRRAILARLALGQTSVSHLAEPFRMSLPAVSKHLRVLEHAGLLRRRKDGRVHRCRLAAEPMRRAAAWIEQYRVFWEDQFEALAKYLKLTREEESTEWRPHGKTRNLRSKSGGPLRRGGRESSKPGSSAND